MRDIPLHKPIPNQIFLDSVKIKPKRSTKKLTNSDLTPETSLLLKQMMKASKLSFSQQRYLDEMIVDNCTLPLVPPPINQLTFSETSKKSSKTADLHVSLFLK